MPRSLTTILADVAAIVDATPPATVQSLRHEMGPYLQGYGDPRLRYQKVLGTDTVAPVGPWPAMSRLTAIVVAGWWAEIRLDANAFWAHLDAA